MKGCSVMCPSAPASSQPEPRQEPALEPEDEITPYRWNAKNVRIAVAGAQRRSGVTVTAFNLAAWLTARGAEVANIEVNTNRHLQLLLNVYEAAPTGEHYAIDGIDCYLTNEPDRDYQFVIYDCGVMQFAYLCVPGSRLSAPVRECPAL